MYCSHVLEHLSLEDCRAALKNTFAYLMSGGRFRLVVPDLESLVKGYLESEAPAAAITFMHESGLGRERRPRGIVGRLRAALGHSAHLWLWDFKSLSNELSNTGFVRIRRAQFGDSSDPAFEAFEERDRWEGCLGMECFRP